jgi:catechol 2,3-dioxygenase-like lactoylglutathione lyase family enzyme
MAQENDTPYRGIDHVQVAAPRGAEAEARRFYGELLGLDELPKPADLAARGGCWFRCGAHQIHIGIEDDFRPAAKAHPAIELRSEAALDALYERLAAAGAQVKRDATEVPGVVRFFVSDPFGNRLELVAKR